MKGTKKIAVCGILSALGTIILFIGGLLGVLDISAACIVSFIVLFCSAEIGLGYGFSVYVIISVLSFLICGNNLFAAFVPGEGFESLLSSDYSQVELRIMADLSGDEALIEAFRSGKDFHKYVASLVYGIPVDDITSDQRSHVKAMSYGLAYGLSTYGLAQQLKIKPKEAESLKNQYFATFGKVHEYLESLVSSAREKGYTETIFGRRRYFPGLKSPNRAVRDAAERAALNAPIQGSAADIMKIAMIRAYDALQEANLGSRLILQIHDELVVEIAPGEEKQATALVKDAMEHAVTMAVPLDVSTGIGSDWQLAAH